MQNYLNIVEGNFPSTEQSVEFVDFGVVTEGVQINDTYHYDNGLRWLTVINETDEYWEITTGYLEYDADDQSFIKKWDLSNLIRENEVVLQEKNNTILSESNEVDGKYLKFMENVDRYLYLNCETESTDYDYDWINAWKDNLSPSVAAEEAIVLG